MAYGDAFAALSDPTRRRVFEELRSGPKPVGVIAGKLPVSRPAVSQHLKVLREAGLVGDRPEGTRRVYYIDPRGLAELRSWLDRFWDRSLAAFAEAVERDDSVMEQTAMDRTITVAPVRKSVTVKASPERAFEVFTAGMVVWWNRQYSINRSPIKDIVVEPREGGRWFERGEDGSECPWGKVLVWGPPTRLVLAWQIQVGERWHFNPELMTELEVRFTPDGTGITRVELEHRNLDRLGEQAAMAREIFDSPAGWQGLLDGFARALA